MKRLPLVTPGPALTVDEVRRYSRHLIIPDVAMAGQQRLMNAKVLCVGAGGLGSPALMYLAAAGVGTIGIVEFDTVDESNLQRQIIHGQSDIGKSKAQSAKEKILEINPYVNVITLLALNLSRNLFFNNKRQLQHSVDKSLVAWNVVTTHEQFAEVFIS